jgi:hypothetical protein
VQALIFYKLQRCTGQERSDWDAESAKALAAGEAKLAAAVQEKVDLEARMEDLLQELSAARIENKSLAEALSAYKSSLAATVRFPMNSRDGSLNFA